MNVIIIDWRISLAGLTRPLQKPNQKKKKKGRGDLGFRMGDFRLLSLEITDNRAVIFGGRS